MKAEEENTGWEEVDEDDFEVKGAEVEGVEVVVEGVGVSLVGLGLVSSDCVCDVELVAGRDDVEIF